jgi:Type VI secretion system/phage-baseplate injector OB domain
MSLDAQYSSRFNVSIMELPLMGSVSDRLMRATVDTAINMPCSCILEFRDSDSTVVEETRAIIGAPLSVRVTNELDPAGIPIFDGEVTAIEAEYDQRGNRTILRGYDKLHRLQRGTKTNAYRFMTYGEIAAEIALRNGLIPGEIVPDETGPHIHVAQADVDDWRFLQSLAARIGYEVAVTEGTLSFRPATPAELAPPAIGAEDPDPLTLNNGDSSILRLRIGLSAAQQVDRAQVQGWDPDVKLPVVGEAPALALNAEMDVLPEEVGLPFGEAAVTSAFVPYSLETDAEPAALALAQRVGGQYVEVEGELVGNAMMQAGMAIGIGGFGPVLSGGFSLTSARHVYDAENGYTTEIFASNQEDRSLYGLTGRVKTGQLAQRAPGLAIGIVTDNMDPEGLGRVTLMFPWLDLEYVSNWARVMQLGAGTGRGMQIIPQVGDEVLVGFEHGDVGSPYVIGGLHNGIDRPREPSEMLVQEGIVTKRVFFSTLGHELSFDDSPETFQITLASGDERGRVVVGGEENTITIAAVGGNVMIESASECTLKAGGMVNVEAEGEVKVSGTGSVQVSSAADVEVTSQGNLSLKGGAAVEITSEGVVEIRGTIVQLN